MRREAWASLKPQIEEESEVARIDELLGNEAILLEFVAGDTVSIVVTGHLLNRYPGGILGGNSKSDYPDLYLKDYDYSKLPVRSRKETEYAAALRGNRASRSAFLTASKSKLRATTQTSTVIFRTSAYISCSRSSRPVKKLSSMTCS